MKLLRKKMIVLAWAITLLIIYSNFAGCGKRRDITPTCDMDMEKDFWIRVLLFDNTEECTLSAETGFTVVDADINIKAHYLSQNGPIKLRLSDGRIVLGEQTFNSDLTILPDEPFVISVNGNPYRGNLRLIANPDHAAITVINTLPIEAYLKGVIGAEMPSYWEKHALMAQTVAARTYCMFIKGRRGQNRNWDVRKTQANQVYKGIRAENPTVREAVEETNGQVLLCKDPEGKKALFPTYYSSSCGGHTENSKNVFGDSYTSLRGVKCPYCKDVAKKNFFRWKQVTFDIADVSKKLLDRYPTLKKLGNIKTIEPADTSKYKDMVRVNSIKLTGTNGKSDYLRAEDFRLTVDPTGNRIKSNAYRFHAAKGKIRFSSGRGYGHAVGMCQCGAEAMARKSKSFRKILKFYYPDSEIDTLY